MSTQALLSACTLWRRRRTETLLAVVLIGCGVALGTAALALHRSLHWQALPYREDLQLYWIWSVRPDVDRAFFSIPDFHDLRARSTQTVAIAGHTPFDANLRREGIAGRVSGLRVSGNFFSTLDVAPIHGRLIDDEDVRSAARHVVLDWPMFQRELGGDPTRLGSALDFDGSLHVVIGVMPPGFLFPGAETDPTFAVPLALDADPRRENRGANFIRPIVRARHGVGLAALREEFARICAELAESYPDTNAMKLAPAVIPLREEMAGKSGRLSAVVLTSIGMLLAVIAMNLASLSLLGSRRRAGEFAVRRALGADHARALRPLLFEHALIGLAGVTLGLLALAPVADALHAAIDDPQLRLAPAVLHVGDYGIAALLGAVLVTAIVAPTVWVQTRARAPIQELRGAASGRRDVGYGRGILAAEIALTTALCVALATTVSTWRALDGRDLGFATDRIATLRMSLPTSAYPDASTLNAYLHRAGQALGDAGIEHAFASALPLSQINSRTDFAWAGFDPGRAGEVPTAQVRWVSPNYFDFMRIEVREGRGTTLADHAAAEPIAVVDTALEARYWRGAKALDDTITVSGQPPTRVVGVVDAVPHFELGETANGTIYLPIEQLTPRYSAFVTSRFSLLGRSAMGTERTLDSMRRALHGIDPLLAPSLPLPMQTYVDQARRGVDVALRLLGTLSLCTVGLCLVGAFALSAAAGHARRREIAIRLAIGSTASRVRRVLLRDALVSLLIGLALGGWLAWAAHAATSHALGPGSQLRVEVVGPLLVVLIASILLAASWPARRHAAVAPSEVLRAE